MHGVTWTLPRVTRVTSNSHSSHPSHLGGCHLADELHHHVSLENGSNQHGRSISLYHGILDTRIPLKILMGSQKHRESLSLIRTNQLDTMGASVSRDHS
jgi:hypothetical protein